MTSATSSSSAPHTLRVCLVDGGPLPAALTAAFPGAQILSQPGLEGIGGAGQGPQTLVIVTPAAIALAQGLAQGGGAAEVREAWVARTRLLLEQLRPLRRQTVLVDRTALRTDPAAVLARLGPLIGSEPQPDQAVAEAPDWDPVLAFLGAALVSDQPEATRLADELEALTLSRVDNPSDGLAGLAAVLSELRARDQARDRVRARLEASQQAEDRAQAEIARLTEERALLLEEVEALAEQLDAGATAERLAQARLAAAQVALAQVRQDARHREAVLAALVMADAADMAGLTETVTRVGQDLTQAQQGLALRDAEAEALRRSTSWKITGPLRAISRGVGRS